MSENGGWRWGEVVIGSMRLAGKGKALLYDLNALFGLNGGFSGVPPWPFLGVP